MAKFENTSDSEWVHEYTDDEGSDAVLTVAPGGFIHADEAPSTQFTEVAE